MRAFVLVIFFSLSEATVSLISINQTKSKNIKSHTNQYLDRNTYPNNLNELLQNSIIFVNAPADGNN